MVCRREVVRPAKIHSFPSVVYCDYMDMSSSAGNWSGLIIQRLNRQLHTVVFSQENFYLPSGFDVETQSYPIVSVKRYENRLSPGLIRAGLQSAVQ